MRRSREWQAAMQQVLSGEDEPWPWQSCCFLCEQLWTEPASAPCGHTFCSRCILRHWDQEAGQQAGLQGRYSCPLCLQSFSPRPELLPNSALEEDVRMLKEKVDSVWAGPGDVACDVCIRRKRKATRTCVGCRISFCESHVHDHLHKEPYQRHQLVPPGISLKEPVCPVHHQYITLFCRTDQHILCPTCAARQHAGHDVVPAAAEVDQRRTLVPSQTESCRSRLQRLLQEQENVQAMLKDAKVTACLEITVRSKDFSSFIKLLQKRQAEVEQDIRERRGKVQELQGRVEQELVELRRQQTELDSLSSTVDLGKFLLEYKTVSQSSSVEHPPGFADVTAALCDLSEKLRPCTNLGVALTQNPLLLQLPTTRRQYLQHALNITLDPNTAHRRLLLSRDDCRVTAASEQPYPPHPDRFQVEEAVLSRQELRGRCYFEVEWRTPRGFVGVTYRSIGRKGRSRGSVLGMSDASWALDLQGNAVSLWHGGERLPLANPPLEHVSRMGVFLDHAGGTLCLFGISRGEMFQFAKVQTQFQKPLLVAVRFTGGEDYFEFVKLK